MRLDYLRSPFIRNIAKLASGSALTQIIAIACAPVITRLFTPESFGLLGVFMAIAGVASTISTLRYDVALMLPKSDASAWSLLRLAAFWSPIAVVIVFVIIYPFRETLALRLNTPELAPYFTWLPLMVLSSGWIGLASHWAVRKKCFGMLSITSVSGSIFGNALKIGGGLIGFGGGLLIVAAFLQNTVQLLLLSFRLRKEVPVEPSSSEEGWRLAKEHRDFPLYRMPQDVMAMLAGNLPNILLAAYFSPVVVGLYLLAHRMTMAPMSLIRESVRKVFYQKATELEHQGGDLYGSVVKMTLGLVLVCLPFVLILAVWGELIFATVFGSEWQEAGRYAKYIGALILASVANTPSVVVVPILGKNRGLLFYECFATSGRVVAIVIGGTFLTAINTIALFSFVSTVFNLALITWVLLSLKKRNYAGI